MPRFITDRKTTKHKLINKFYMKKADNGYTLVKWIVTIMDFIILNATIIAFLELTPDILPQFFEQATKLTLFVANISLLVAEMSYSTIIHVRKVSFADVLKRTFNLAVLTTFFLFLSVRLLSNSGGQLYFCTVFLATFYVLLILTRVVERSVLNYFRMKGYNSRSAVFVGNDPAVLNMYQRLLEDPAAGYRIMGYYADKKMEKAPEEFKYLGTMDDLNKLIDGTMDKTIHGTPIHTHELFCSLSHDFSDEIVKIMRFCNKNVVHFYYIPRTFGEYQLNLTPKTMMGMGVFSSHKEPLNSLGNKVLKRSFDIAVSGIVCLVMLPFMPVIAFIIKRQSPGPLFFKQKRTGLNGTTFNCLKFRSMHVNKDADKAQATKDDPRKFAFGNFMRKTNIDEFPQFINVLKGDMSIVGPRPHMLYHTEKYGELIDKYMVRHFCKPGITGWAQVTGYRGETRELWQMEKRIHRDIWYIENWSFWLDLRIIFLTAKSIIFPDKKAY